MGSPCCSAELAVGETPLLREPCLQRGGDVSGTPAQGFPRKGAIHEPGDKQKGWFVIQLRPRFISTTEACLSPGKGTILAAFLQAPGKLVAPRFVFSGFSIPPGVHLLGTTADPASDSSRQRGQQGSFEHSLRAPSPRCPGTAGVSVAGLVCFWELVCSLGDFIL